MALHVVIYFAALRRLSSFSEERTIFFYHFFSALFCTAAGVVFSLYLQTPENLAAATALIFAHGVYSLSFLELWSLSQISYSREILLLAANEGHLQRFPPPASLVSTGDSKKVGRLDSLFRLGLLRHTGEYVMLTPKGSAIAGILRLVAWFPNLKRMG